MEATQENIGTKKNPDEIQIKSNLAILFDFIWIWFWCYLDFI